MRKEKRKPAPDSVRSGVGSASRMRRPRGPTDCRRQSKVQWTALRASFDTTRRAVSKWPLEKHTRQWGCIACVHSHYAVREVKRPLQMHTRQWAAACMRPFTVRRAGSKMAFRDAHTPMGSACIRPWTCTRMRRHRCRNPYLFA